MTPLAAAPGAVTPNGEVGVYEGADGAVLRAAVFVPQGPVRGSVIVSPGRTEPIEKYYEVIGDLHRRGLMVLVHDWRGQGGSHRMHDDRLAGHAVHLEDFIEDYRRLLTVYGPRLPRPWISLSHSMGGCFSLLAAEEGVGPLDALAMSAPMLSIRLSGALKRVSRQLVWLMARLGLSGRAIPGPMRHPLDDHFEFDRLTHDHGRYVAFKAVLRANPDLALGPPTWGWLRVAIEGMLRARKPEELAKVAVPVLIAGAGEDRLCNSSVAAEAAAALPRGRYIEIAGAYHEILIETDERRAQFWAAFDELTAPVLSANA